MASDDSVVLDQGSIQGKWLGRSGIIVHFRGLDCRRRVKVDACVRGLSKQFGCKRPSGQSTITEANISTYDDIDSCFGEEKNLPIICPLQTIDGRL